MQSTLFHNDTEYSSHPVKGSKEVIRERQQELLAIVDIYTETIKILKKLKHTHTPHELMLDYLEGQIRLIECHDNKYQTHYSEKLRLLLFDYAETGMLMID